MGKLESKVKDALSEIKSADPDVRHDGLMKLKDITVENKGGECDISLLKDMIKLAAGPFERTGEEWDDPSLVLLEFVVDYMEERVARDLTRHIAEFSEMGKQCVLYHTSMHEHDGAVRALIEMYEILIPLNQAWFPHAVLEQNGVVSKALINHFYTRLDDKACRRDLYRILANLHEEKVFYQFKPEVIKPLIHRHWEEAKAAYLQYDRDYKTKHVHCSWKDSYLHIREELENFLKLMDVYWGEEWLPYLEEAKGWNDPIVKTIAVTVSLKRGIPVDQEEVYWCATHVESAELFHWRLIIERIEHHNPVKDSRQSDVARTHLFYYLLFDREESLYAEEITILDQIDTFTAYEEPVRYYLASYRDLSGHVYPAWVGAFSLEEGQDSLFKWDDSTILEEPLESRNVEGWKTAFMQERKERMEKEASEIHYEAKTKEGAVLIKGNSLIVHSREGDRSIFLKDIQTLTIEWKKGGLFGLKKIPMVAVYEKGGGMFMTYPESEIDYEKFAGAVHEQTESLEEPPFIEFLEVG